MGIMYTKAYVAFVVLSPKYTKAYLTDLLFWLLVCLGFMILILMPDCKGILYVFTKYAWETVALFLAIHRESNLETMTCYLLQALKHAKVKVNA